MKVHQFLDHYGITENPFAQEDAQSDKVFQQHCLTGTYHPAWDKVFGDPATPSTAVVFGEQGSGKTAMRLQIVGRLDQHNREQSGQRAFIVEYDDFNPFLDNFRERLSGRRRRPEKALQSWRLWDHMDAILSLAVTRLANDIRNQGEDPNDSAMSIRTDDLAALTRPQRRDILLLAACYDNSREIGAKRRWNALRRKLRFSTWRAKWDRALGLGVTVLVVALFYWLFDLKSVLTTWWAWLLIAIGWAPFVMHQAWILWQSWWIRRQIRVIDHQTMALRKILSSFERSEIIGQSLPAKARGDDRYELLNKLQAVLKSLGFTSLVVLVDRVDEPHLINGSPERMRDMLWPMFDNKFLKHPGIAFKLLLPSAVVGYLNRQEKEFYEKSRLDKQNLIPSLTWTGQGLFDIANDRIRACAKLAETRPGIRDLFDASITEPELIATFDRLRAPRHMFKFMYRLLVDHCSKYTEDQPEWKIQRETLHATLALFLRDLEAYDNKRGTG
ncbi:MAG: hypothetical protein KF774_01585 [Planctomyces sp.]|nr:hypothetical protein [Planctomyces sp.]